MNKGLLWANENAPKGIEIGSVGRETIQGMAIRGRGVCKGWGMFI